MTDTIKISERTENRPLSFHPVFSGTTSPAALATTVGVLTEVPVMLALCWFANKTRGWFQ